MAKIDASFGEGGANITTEKHGDDSTLAEVLRDMADDLTAIRTSITTLTAKLDTEGTLGGGYATACDPPALLTEKV